MLKRMAIFLAVTAFLATSGPRAWADEQEESEAEAEAEVTPSKPVEKVKPAAPQTQAPAQAKGWDAAIAERFLEGEFPAKVIEPAVARALSRLFLSEAEGKEQAREAVQAAMSKLAERGRELLGELFEAIVAKDRAAYEQAHANLTKSVDQRTGYWNRAVAKFFPDLVARGRPLARVGVSRAYSCSNAFLGRAMGLGETGQRRSTARALRKALTRDERREACQFVRRWAEARAVAELERVLESLRKSIESERGEKTELPADRMKLADRIKRLLERELVTIVGDYRESMSRIRAAAEQLAEALPPRKEEPKPIEPATPAAPEPAAPAPAAPAP